MSISYKKIYIQEQDFNDYVAKLVQAVFIADEEFLKLAYSFYQSGISNQQAAQMFNTLRKLGG